MVSVKAECCVRRTLLRGFCSDLETMIRRIAGLGISILLIEHHVDLIMALADNVTVLDYGQVIASDAPAAIQVDPRVIEAYFGASIAHADTAA